MSQESFDSAGMTQIDTSNANPQVDSPLFTKVPGEIRNKIYDYVLQSYEDGQREYDEDTPYRRPGYFAKHRTDAELLQTCKAVYQEAWFIPFSKAIHTFFFTWDSRRPDYTVEPEDMMRTLHAIYNSHGAIELDDVRVVAQLCNLESGRNLDELLTIPHFYPKTFTITIRHTDWWNWESDTPLRIASHFAKFCEFPASVSTLVLELESLERKKAQVDYIAKKMKNEWRFQRTDGTCLYARDQPVEEVRWTGSSTWEGDRWIRDEIKSRPDVIDYYVVNLTFKPERRPSAEESVKERPWEVPNLRVTDSEPINSEGSSLSTDQLRDAGVSKGTDKEAALRIVTEFYDARMREYHEAQLGEDDMVLQAQTHSVLD